MATDQKALFTATPDPLLTLTNQQVAVDSSTEYRQCRIYEANVGGNGTLAAPLNNGSQTRFEIHQGSGAKWRLSTMGLRLRMTFALPALGAAPPTKCCPPWNMVGHLIQSISFTVNGCDKPIFNSSTSHYGTVFTAKLLKQFTYDQLNQADDFVFTPMPAADDFYSLAAAADAAWASGTQLVRGDRWIGANSHLKEVVKIIPFSVLLPYLGEGIPTNLSEFQLTIQWASTTDLLEKNSAHANGDGRVFLTNADIIADSYVLSATSSVSQTMEKLAGQPDVIPYLDFEVLDREYSPGSSISIPGVRNLDTIMVLQHAKGRTNAANPVDLTYSSSGDFLFFGTNAGADVAHTPTRADFAPANGTVACVSSVQIEVGGVSYPSREIKTNQLTLGTTVFEPSHLWFEYARSCGKLTSRERSCAIPMSVMKATMPFICLKPWSDHASHITNEGKQVIISMVGGGAGTVRVVLMKLKVLQMNSDGSVIIHGDQK